MTDITQNITAPDRHLLRTTRRIGMLSYKSAKVRFDHRTTVQGVSFPSTFRLTEEELTRTFSQFYLSDGNQSLSITGKVEAEFPDTITTGSPPWAEVLISIKAVDRYWNRVTGEWEVGFYANRFGMTDTEGAVGEETDIKFEANINMETGLIPDLPGDELEIIFYVARSTNTDPVVISNYSDFINFQLTINNPAVAEGQNTAIDYQLTQQSAARGRYDDGSIWFGDGPTAYARSAITRDEAGDELTSEWRFSDETTPIIHANILLREVMDMKRTQVRGLAADLLGEYKPCKMPNIDDFFHFFIGGNQNGKDNKWSANLFRLNRMTELLPSSSFCDVSNIADAGLSQTNIQNALVSGPTWGECLYLRISGNLTASTTYGTILINDTLGKGDVEVSFTFRPDGQGASTAAMGFHGVSYNVNLSGYWGQANHDMVAIGIFRFQSGGARARIIANSATIDSAALDISAPISQTNIDNVMNNSTTCRMTASRKRGPDTPGGDPTFDFTLRVENLDNPQYELYYERNIGPSETATVERIYDRIMQDGADAGYAGFFCTNYQQSPTLVDRYQVNRMGQLL